jgi:hypothetical protein
MAEFGGAQLDRINALQSRVRVLSSLRRLVGLTGEQDISPRQWELVESALAAVQSELLARVTAAARSYLPLQHEVAASRTLNDLLGDVDLDLSTAMTLFDTYMDILTQRRTPELGRLLAGCDVLAYDAVARDHPALRVVEGPLVSCDRGFGASTLRAGVRLPDGSPNPLPIIQVPYSRLQEKHTLTSILHEVGHEALVRLELVHVLPEALQHALRVRRASSAVQSAFALWSSEIGPDLWTFCGSGIASAGGLRDLLLLPTDRVLAVSWTDPHPPPYLRVLLGFELCRQTWGRGVWDEWEKEWVRLYDLARAPANDRRVLQEAVFFVPLVASVLLHTRFRVLARRSIPDLFDLPGLAPARLEAAASAIESGTPSRTASPMTQLAVLRLVKLRGRLSPAQLDAVATQWLRTLGRRRRETVPGG